MPARIWRAMPSPPAPAPNTTTRSSVSLRPMTRHAPSSPASATAPVPWISSLNDGSTLRYLFMIVSAFSLRKSSHCNTAPGNSVFTACTNSSISASYSAPRSRGCRRPRYSGSSSNALLSVPDVDADRQRLGRVDAGRRGVQRQLADRNADAAGALIADAENRFVVGHDDQADAAPSGRVAQRRSRCRRATPA